MDVRAILIFLGIVIISSVVRAARRGNSDQQRPTQPGPVAPPFGGGLDPSRRMQRPGFPGPQAPRKESPGVPWRSQAASKPPLVAQRPWSGEGQEDLSREVVEEEALAMEAETSSRLFEASTLGRDADRMGREAEERMGATSLRAEADSLGTLAGTNVAVRAGAAQVRPTSATLASWLKSENLAQAVVLTEVLGRPKALARRTGATGRHRV